MPQWPNAFSRCPFALATLLCTLRTINSATTFIVTPRWSRCSTLLRRWWLDARFSGFLEIWPMRWEPMIFSQWSREVLDWRSSRIRMQLRSSPSGLRDSPCCFSLCCSFWVWEVTWPWHLVWWLWFGISSRRLSYGRLRLERHLWDSWSVWCTWRR